jgi:hypothetical protein
MAFPEEVSGRFCFCDLSLAWKRAALSLDVRFAIERDGLASPGKANARRP